jgi:hypothetical protein
VVDIIQTGRKPQIADLTKAVKIVDESPGFQCRTVNSWSTDELSGVQNGYQNLVWFLLIGQNPEDATVGIGEQIAKRANKEWLVPQLSVLL